MKSLHIVDDSAESKAKKEITKQILNQVYSPGETVSENQLADHLNMSRTPVRTAIRELISEGLLERIHPKGYIVAKLTGGDRKQVFTIREKLEGLAAELAASLITPEMAEKLESLQIELKDIFENWDRDRFTNNNERFHMLIAEASGNIYVQRFLKQCYWRSQLYIYSYDSFFCDSSDTESGFSESPYCFTVSDHGAITKAILQHNAVTAREKMEQHIRNSYESFTAVQNKLK